MTLKMDITFKRISLYVMNQFSVIIFNRIKLFSYWKFKIQCDAICSTFEHFLLSTRNYYQGTFCWAKKRQKINKCAKVCFYYFPHTAPYCMGINYFLKFL